MPKPVRKRSFEKAPDLAQQRAALRAAGCGRLFEEKASGGRWDRPELHRLLDHLRPGDVVVVWKLDRLSRSINCHTAAVKQFYADGSCPHRRHGAAVASELSALGP